MPIPLHIVKLIPGALAQPLGMAKQITLNDAGQRIPKYRLTQDLSFFISQENCSVNDRIDMEQYNEMVYGWCLSRIIHYIVALGERFPTNKILMSKYDYSDAYRRIASATTQSISVFKGIAYVALRLTFGGSQNPPTWCLFSEMVTDLANEIYMCQDWDPAQLRSAWQPVTPTPKRDDNDDEQFSQALPTAIKVPTLSTAKRDGFIDDLITVFRDTPEKQERAPHTVPLAMHVTSRPQAGQNEPITRQNILADHKLIAEGSPAETHIILGWKLKTRRLLISIPKDKFDAWKSELQKMIKAGRTTFGDLETTVGRLNHVAYVIPLARHFLNWLRAKFRTPRHKHQSIRLAAEEVQDLTLWTRFLTEAHKGISLNRITICVPSKLTISDACPFGVGGYSLRGPAWRFTIPKSSPSRRFTFQQPLGIPRNGGRDLDRDTRSQERKLRVHTSTGRQRLCNWMAIPLRMSRPKIALL
jgi:hypothetical protein